MALACGWTVPAMVGSILETGECYLLHHFCRVSGHHGILHWCACIYGPMLLVRQAVFHWGYVVGIVPVTYDLFVFSNDNCVGFSNPSL